MPWGEFGDWPVKDRHTVGFHLVPMEVPQLSSHRNRQ